MRNRNILPSRKKYKFGIIYNTFIGVDMIEIPI